MPRSKSTANRGGAKNTQEKLTDVARGSVPRLERLAAMTVGAPRRDRVPH